MFTSIINIRRNNVQKSLLPLSKAIWTHLSLKHIVKMLVIVLLAILPFSLGDRCQHPPPAANYQNSLYQGRWYEIGKVINQTNFFSTQFQNHFGESNFSFYCQVFHIVILNDEWSKSMRKPAGYIIIYDESTTSYKEKIVAEPRICAKSQKTRFVIFRILLQLSFFFPFEKTDFILRNSISHPSSCVWKARSKIYALLSITTIFRSKLLEEQVFKREQSARLLLIIPTRPKWGVVPLDTVPEKRPPQETMSTLQVHLKKMQLAH